MKKTLNPEIKKYIINFAIDQLENCKLFTKTFGKGFAEQKLYENVKNVYTNEKSKISSGYYNFEDNSITICESGKDNTLLTVSDIQTIEDIAETILHECIHAILNKNKEECEKLNIKWGSGLLEKYDNDSEVGRGLNEGLTNWIVEKVGIKATSYEKLTNFIKQLEIYIGPDRVMRLGEGGIHNDIHKCLKMSKTDGVKLLLKGDEYYSLCNVYSYIYIIKEILQKNKKEDGTINLDEKALEELGKVRYNFYTNPQKYIEYRKFLEEKELQDTVENKLKFCEEYMEALSKMMDYQEIDIESFLFDIYLKDKFEAMKNNIDKVSIQDFKNILTLETLMSSADTKDYRSSVVFKTEIKEFKDKFFENQITKIKEGTINKKEFLELMDIFYSNEFSDNNLHDNKLVFINELSKIIYSKNINIGNKLIETLISKRDIDEIDRYSFQEIKSKDGQSVCLYYKDGKIQFAGNSYKTNIMTVDNEIDKPEEIVDYTTEIGVKDINIINNFLHFKENIKKRDPKAKISISNKAIIVESSKDIKKKAFFIISGENIVHAIPEVKNKVNIKFVDNKQSLAIVIRRSNFISNIFENIRNIRNRIFRNNYNNFNNSDTSNTVLNMHKDDLKEDKFNNELRNFDPIKDKQEIHSNKKVRNKESDGR